MQLLKSQFFIQLPIELPIELPIVLPIVSLCPEPNYDASHRRGLASGFATGVDDLAAGRGDGIPGGQ